MARGQYNLLAAGARAPQFELARLGGGSVRLADLLENGPVLLGFFKINCPVCQLTFPFLERIHAAGGLPIYGVSQNDEADTRWFMEEYGITFPMLLDSEESGYPASNGFGISHVPTLFLVERDGTIGRVIESWNREEVAALGAHAGVAVMRPTDNVPAFKAG
jgi:peroxiredoxin